MDDIYAPQGQMSRALKSREAALTAQVSGQRGGSYANAFFNDAMYPVCPIARVSALQGPVIKQEPGTEQLEPISPAVDRAYDSNFVGLISSAFARACADHMGKTYR